LGGIPKGEKLAWLAGPAVYRLWDCDNTRRDISHDDCGPRRRTSRTKIDVRFWHKADIRCGAMQCPLLGVKRTLIGSAPMSACDPKRTSVRRHGATTFVPRVRVVRI